MFLGDAEAEKMPAVLTAGTCICCWCVGTHRLANEVTQAVLDAWTVLQARAGWEQLLLLPRCRGAACCCMFHWNHRDPWACACLQDPEKRKLYDITWTKMRRLVWFLLILLCVHASPTPTPKRFSGLGFGGFLRLPKRVICMEVT